MKRKLLSIVAGISFVASNALTIHIPADYPTIQQGINNAVNGDTVLVHSGNYVENINFSGKNIVVASQYLTTNDTTYISTTVIASSPNANLNSSVVTFENNETTSAQLIGLTLLNGGGNYRILGADHVFYGGGVYCYNASPLLSHLVIKNNTPECGGGVFLYSSNTTIENCVIEDNTCNSIASAAPNAGAAIATWNCQNVIIRNTRIQNNNAERAGGAIYTLTSNATIVNCLITGNHSNVMGAAFYSDSWSNVNIINSTVCGNLCDPGPGLRGSGVMYCLDSAKVQINNSIFYNNQPAAIVCQFTYSLNEISVSHSDFEGGADSIITNNNGNNVTVNWLNGNINTNPVFVNTALNDYHLQPTSPCINTGDTTGVSSIPPIDLDSNNRFYGIIDMGCYEFQGSVGVSETNSESGFVVYPNPASGFIVLESTRQIGDLIVTLYDLNGSVVYLHDFSAGQMRVEIPVSHLSNGVYFLRWTDGKNTEGKKVIVAH